MGMKKMLVAVLICLILAAPAIAQVHGIEKNPLKGDSVRGERGQGNVLETPVMDRMFVETKEKMMKWERECNEFMERLKERVKTMNIGEDVKLKIQERIRYAEQQMEIIREKMMNSRNYEELRNAMIEISKIWKNAHRELKLATYEHAIARAEKILEGLENLADRFETSGLDVSKLRSSIENAKNIIESIKNKIENGASEKDIAEEFKKLNLTLKMAFDEAKNLAKEYKPAPSNGIVQATVNGTFKLEGKMVALITGRGTVDAKADSVTKVEKDGVMNVVLRGDVSATGNGKFRIVLHGSGELEMSGEGSYAYKRCVNEKFATGEFSESITLNFGC